MHSPALCVYGLVLFLRSKGEEPPIGKQAYNERAQYQNLPNMFLLRGNNLNSLIQNRHPFLIQIWVEGFLEGWSRSEVRQYLGFIAYAQLVIVWNFWTISKRLIKFRQQIISIAFNRIIDNWCGLGFGHYARGLLWSVKYKIASPSSICKVYLTVTIKSYSNEYTFP